MKLAEPTKFAIVKKKLLLVEGKDEVAFVNALLNELGIADVQIQDMGGKDKFPRNILGLPTTTGFESLQLLGILRDAEENLAKSTFDSVCSDMKRVNLPEPQALMSFSATTPSIGVFVMPDNQRPGMLEDLCLESLANTDEITHTDDFFTKVNVTSSAKDFSKRRVQAWLSISQTSQYLQRELGTAAKAGFWNFDHHCFNQLKAFLEQFR